jgi:RNase adapter protein RapZ
LPLKHPELDVEKAYRVLLEREQLGSTGIGEGVAIPHGKMAELDRIILVVGRSTTGVDFAALDFRPCTIFFLVLAPEHVAGLHLRILAHVSRLLRDDAFRGAFLGSAGQKIALGTPRERLTARSRRFPIDAPFLPVLILTGQSGAGKSTALNVFEDLRFYCVDGLPASLLPTLGRSLRDGQGKPLQGVRLGIDARQADFLIEWQQAMEFMSRGHLRPRIIFLEARPAELMRRYATTRRLHPLESQEKGLEQAIEMESEILDSVRREADVVIDTSEFSIHDLRRVLHGAVDHLQQEEATACRVHLISFGFKYGVPREADLMFDCASFQIPTSRAQLRPLSGKDSQISPPTCSPTRSGDRSWSVSPIFSGFSCPST